MRTVKLVKVKEVDILKVKVRLPPYRLTGHRNSVFFILLPELESDEWKEKNTFQKQCMLIFSKAILLTFFLNGVANYYVDGICKKHF